MVLGEELNSPNPVEGRQTATNTTTTKNKRCFAKRAFSRNDAIRNLNLKSA
jgi:hypothetical protein